jgi:hypothetical protein
MNKQVLDLIGAAPRTRVCPTSPQSRDARHGSPDAARPRSTCPLRGIPPTALERTVEGGRPRGRTVGLPPSASGRQMAHLRHPTPATPARRQLSHNQRRGRASYARPASSNSLTASRLFSATAACARCVFRGTSEHVCVNGRGSPSHQRRHYLKRPLAVAMNVLGHVLSDGQSLSPSLQWLQGICPVGAGRSTRPHTPLPSRPCPIFPGWTLRKRLVRAASFEKALVAGGLEPSEPLRFLGEIGRSRIGRKFRKRGGPAREARDPVVFWGVLPPPILLAESHSCEWAELPVELSTVSHSGQAEAQCGHAIPRNPTPGPSLPAPNARIVPRNPSFLGKGSLR